MNLPLVTLLSLTVLLLSGCNPSTKDQLSEATSNKDKSTLIEVDDKTAQKQIFDFEEKPVLIEFYASWCPPCKILTPRVEELAKKYDSKLKFVKIDVEKAPHIVEKYNIISIPTIQIYSKKCPDEKTLVGVKSIEKLEKFIDKALKDCN